MIFFFFTSFQFVSICSSSHLSLKHVLHYWDTISRRNDKTNLKRLNIHQIESRWEVQTENNTNESRKDVWEWGWGQALTKLLVKCTLHELSDLRKFEWCSEWILKPNLKRFKQTVPYIHHKFSKKVSKTFNSRFSPSFKLKHQSIVWRSPHWWSMIIKYLVLSHTNKIIILLLLYEVKIMSCLNFDINKYIFFIITTRIYLSYKPTLSPQLWLIKFWNLKLYCFMLNIIFKPIEIGILDCYRHCHI